MSFSVVSWNINSIKARLPRLQQYLARARPDIVCLQELKCEARQFPAAEIHELGYEYVAHGQRTYNGVAILSREPIDLVATGFGDAALDEQSRLIHARTYGIDVLSAYVPNGQDVGTEKYVYKLKWLKQLRKYLVDAFEDGDEFAVCGDFNVATDDRDVFDPAALQGQLLYSLPERQALARLSDGLLVDTFRQFELNAGHYSWWDYRSLGFQLGKGLRIDYVYASLSLSEYTTRAWIERDERKGERPSDHAPVVAEFNLDAD